MWTSTFIVCVLCLRFNLDPGSVSECFDEFLLVSLHKQFLCWTTYSVKTSTVRASAETFPTYKQWRTRSIQDCRWVLANLLQFFICECFFTIFVECNIILCLLQKEEIARQFNFLPERKSKIATLLKQEDAQEYCICRSSDSNRFMMYVIIHRFQLSTYIHNSSLISIVLFQSMW